MDALARDAAGDDWLTVNVWSPEPDPGAGLPVMVWIQGGGYVIGMSGLPEYDGGRLARDGGVVVVTFNYRVGIEGFAQIEGAPANRGLLDQVAALEWVRDNIRAFGGDPDRVTVFGQSAGGGSVAALLAMPRAAGLFRRAVVQSVPGTFFSPELAADIAGVLRRRAGAAAHGGRPVHGGPGASCPPPVTRSAPRWTSGRTAGAWPRTGRSRFSPVVDGDVLPVTPWQALADGAGRDVDLLVGPHPRRAAAVHRHRRAARPGRPRSRRRPPWTCSRPARTARAATARPSRRRARTSSTSWSTPTGCSACRRSTSPRRRRPAAAGRTSTS